MFRTIKWVIILLILATIWFTCDFASNLSESEKKSIKNDFVEAIDKSNPSVFTGSVTDKMTEKIEEKKNNFFEKIKAKFKNMIEKAYDEDSLSVPLENFK